MDPLLLRPVLRATTTRTTNAATAAVAVAAATGTPTPTTPILSTTTRSIPSSPTLLLPRHPRRTFTTTPTHQESSARRTKGALNIAPHASFLLGKEDHIIFNPPASAATVYNTPYKFLPKNDPRRRASLTSRLFSETKSPSQTLNPSVPTPPPSPYPPPTSHKKKTKQPGGITAPMAFLSEDNTAKKSTPPSESDILLATTGRSKLPHLVRKHEAEESRTHLEPADVEEIRRLRNEDPNRWSVVALARKFDCAAYFIMACVQGSDQHHKELKAMKEKREARWGPIKKNARAEREKRKKMVLSGRL